ncbi:MAG: DNA-binding domain-containing protein [Neomegalonema sp.]|nr:DNA-binding domain-containing protein [Neomegalonema sp.]
MQPEEEGAYQAEFTAALLDPNAQAPSAIASGQERRFAVYRNNVIVSLVEALAAAYPAVQALVGEAFFNAAAGLFVRSHPPSSPLMIYYGEGFAEWLERFEPAANLPYLPDVARLERLVLEARNAADAEPLSQQGFAQIAERAGAEGLGGLRFAPHPATRALASAYPIVSIHARALLGGEGELRGAETALVTRPQDEASIIAAPTGTDLALGCFAQGGDLTQAAEQVAEAGGDFSLALSTLIQNGAIRG